MLPRLGEKYDIATEITSKPVHQYQTDEYFELDLPVAPAIMVGDEILVEGSDVSEFELECCLCRHLNLPAPEKKGLLSRLARR